MKNSDGHKLYQSDFYENRRASTLHSATTILGILNDLTEIDSAVDFGCGTGTWLSVAKENGASIVQGVEGEWLDKDLADIPSSSIHQQNLELPVKLERRYDLAISLEVAEHLSATRAESFVADLCAASDLVLFAAAVPGQGGIHHVNEQWQSYWAERFLQNGYHPYDSVRKKIWADNQIPYWYRQNIVVYVKEGTAIENRANDCDKVIQFSDLDRVHPELFAQHVHPTMRQAAGKLIHALKNLNN